MKRSLCQLGAIGQIARSVSDIATSEKWYRDVLGLPHLYTFGTLAFFDCGGTRLMLAQEKTGAAKESILYLRVSDIAAAHDALKQRGVQFTHAPHMIHRHADGTEEWMAFFEDPDGRPLAIMAQTKWDAPANRNVAQFLALHISQDNPRNRRRLRSATRFWA